MRYCLFACLVLLIAGCPAAHADSCEKSREYIFGSLAGDLPMPPSAYNDLFRICIATAEMSNVKDAYLLKDGGLAVIPKQDSIPATATLLAQFCEANPRATLRVLTRKDLALNKSVLDIVRISSTSVTPCKKIKGLT